MALTIAFQTKLSLNIPNVVNNKDYLEYKYLLTRIDKILHLTGMDFEFAEHYINQLSDDPEHKLTAKQIEKYSKYAITGLRCMIIKYLTGAGFRELSVRLAESIKNCCVNKTSEVCLLNTYKVIFLLKKMNFILFIRNSIKKMKKT